MFGIVQKRAYRIEQVNKPKPWDFCTEWNENEIFVYLTEIPHMQDVGKTLFSKCMKKLTFHTFRTHKAPDISQWKIGFLLFH